MNASAIDSGEGCSTKVASAHVQDKPSGCAIITEQTIATSFNNFEDVFGEGNIYDDSTGAQVADNHTDEIAVDRGTDDFVGPTTTANRRDSRKRKSIAPSSDNESVYQNTRHKGNRSAVSDASLANDTLRDSKRKGKQPICNEDPRQRLEESHSISDALRMNEFAVDLQLHGQRHTMFSDATKKPIRLAGVLGL
ncbi:hypothetical protein BGZ72_008597 [Mortierella alpina]|nr:hypothetical protein BGZ72_008597 [Mortierella alpina]